MTVLSATHPPQISAQHAAERMCAITRERRPKPALIRLVLDPNGRLLIDLVGKAPGRGVYVAPEALREAISKKGLGRVFKGRACEVDVESVWGETEARLEARIVELCGLARRAGQVDFGADAVVEALGAGRTTMVVAARDVSPKTLGNLNTAKATVVVVSTKQALGRLFGKEEVGVIAVHPGKLAERLAMEALRLQRLRD